MFEWLQNPNVDFSPEAWKSLFREGSVISALINTVRRRLMRHSKKSSSPFMDRVSLPGSESSRKLNAKTFTQALRHCTHSDPSSPSIMKKKPRERWHPFKHDTDNISCTCRKPTCLAPSSSKCENVPKWECQVWCHDFLRLVFKAVLNGCAVFTEVKSRLTAVAKSPESHH